MAAIATPGPKSLLENDKENRPYPPTPHFVHTEPLGEVRRSTRVEMRKVHLRPAQHFVQEQRSRRLNEKSEQAREQRQSNVLLLRQNSSKTLGEEGAISKKFALLEAILNKERETFAAQRVAWNSERDALVAQREALLVEIEKLRGELSSSQAQCSELQQELDKVRTTSPKAAHTPRTRSADKRKSPGTQPETPHKFVIPEVPVFKTPRTRSADKKRSPKGEAASKQEIKQLLTEAEKRKLAELKKQEEEKAIQDRVEQRKQELREQEEKVKSEAKEKEALMKVLGPRVQRRVQGKSYAELCQEFYPKGRVSAGCDRNTLRSTLRRAMATYHPDRALHLPTLRERVEAELIYEELRNAYEELNSTSRLFA